MIPSSPCRTSIFEQDFKFKYVSGDIHTHVATQNIILTFLWQSGTLTGKINMEFSPNIWNRNSF